MFGSLHQNFKSNYRNFLQASCILWVAFIAATARAQDSDEPKDDAPGLNSGLVSSLAFRNIGPALMSGRIGDIVVDPVDRSTWYIAASSGGVWKTTNNGVTFQPIFDGHGSYSIGCLAIDPHDRFTIWVGTGENNSQRSVGYGDGVYKSIDGGKSFTRVGLENSEHIGKIVVHPTDPQTVFVAAQGPLWKSGGERGLYQTRDGGKTWSQILKISDDTGINEVHLDPHNPDVMYASPSRRRRHTWVLINGGPESGIHKSTDGGQTWRAINRGLPGGDKGRIGLAVSPINPEVLYAIVEAADGSGFYRSTDRGETWQRQSDYVSTSPQYYQEIVACPHKFDRIYSLDTLMMVSEDGGKNFTGLGEDDKHVDNHAMVIDPADENHLLIGCDGGIYESWDRGRTYDYKANLPITQFYKVAVSREQPFYYVYGGTQDNATQGGPVQTTNAHGIRNSDWFVTVFGDGFDPAVDPQDPDIVYSQYQYGGLVRYHRKTGETIDIKPREPKGGPPLRWNWDSALLISPHHPQRIYYGSQILFRSDDRGNSWTAISSDLTRQIDRNQLKVMGRVWGLDAVAKNDSTSFYGNIVALDESPLVDGLIYVGTDDGLVQVSEDGGANWRKIETFERLDIPEFAYISDIKASMHDPNTVYVSINNHKRGDFKPYVVKSADRGHTWIAVHADLPERGSVYCIEQDHVNPNLLFVGTEFGCFCTLDDGGKWLQMSGGMPTIAIRDMEIQREADDLVLASFGRGFFVLDDYSPLRDLTQATIDEPAKLFPIRKGKMFIRSTPLGVSERAFQGANFFVAPNPPYGVAFTLYLKDIPKTKRQERLEREGKEARAKSDTPYPTWDELKAEEREESAQIVATIRDSAGTVVNTLDASPSKGLQRFVWDFRYAPVGGRRGMAPTAVPGKYTIEVAQIFGGETTTLVPASEFEIEPIAWHQMSDVDRGAILAFCDRASRLQNAVRAATEILEEASQRLDTVQQTIQNTAQPNRELLQRARDLKFRVQDLQEKFNGERIPAEHNQPSSPGTTDRVGTMIFASFSASTGPTDTHKRLYEIASEEFNEALQTLKPLVETDLPALYGELDQAQLPWTPGRKIPDWQ